MQKKGSLFISDCLFHTLFLSFFGLFPTFVIPPLQVRFSFASPSLFLRTKVGAKSVEKRFYSEGSTSLLKRSTRVITGN